MGKASKELPLGLIDGRESFNLPFNLCGHLVKAFSHLCQFGVSVLWNLDVVVSVRNAEGGFVQFGKRRHDLFQAEKKKEACEKKKAKGQCACLEKQDMAAFQHIGDVFVGDDLIVLFPCVFCGGIGIQKKGFTICFADDRIIIIKCGKLFLRKGFCCQFPDGFCLKFIGGSVVKLFSIAV